MARWKARLFGEVQLIAPDGAQVPISSAVASILGYLSTRPGLRANKASVVARIWPDQDEDHARRCLATSLWRLRKQSATAHMAIRADGEMLELDPDIWIDSRAFELNAMHLQNDDLAAVARLRGAVSCYAGPYLEGHFEDWVLIERERLFYLYLDANIRLAQLEMRNRKWTDAIEYARRVCMLEPLREDAHRLLMLAYAESGNRGLALKQYNICRDILMRELSVEPMPETSEMAKQLRAGQYQDFESSSLVTAPVPGSLKENLIEGRKALVTAMSALDRALDLA